jgi:type III secretion protein T
MGEFLDSNRGEITLVFTALILASMRIFGCLQFFPLFSGSQISRALKAPIAFALSMPAIQFLIPELRAMSDMTFPFLMILAVKEFVIGVSIGLLAGLPFWSAQAAGDIIDVYRGASAANFSDPINATETSITGILFLRISLALLVVTGGIYTIIAICYESFQVWGVLSISPAVKFDASFATSSFIDFLFKAALLVGGPLLTILLVSDLIVVFIGRGGKQIPISSMDYILKNLLLLVAMPVYIGFLLYFFSVEFIEKFQMLRRVLNLE